MAEDVEGEALATLIVNQIRGVAQELRRQGARVRRSPQGDAAGHGGPDRRPGHLRRARPQARERDRRSARPRQARRRSTRTTPPIIGGGGDKERIDGRIEQIRREIEKTTSDYDREKLQERLAKLSGGVAVIRVGAPAEAEMKSKKEALDDAISATKAAVAEGIVPGGGLALLRCIAVLEAEEAKCERRRANRACRFSSARSRLRPGRSRKTRQRTAAWWSPACWRAKGNYGFDAGRKEYVDLVEAGIIDPTKVVRIALENAVSVASVLLLTEATMTEIPETKKETSAEPEMAL